jgi:hypothetical protein
MTQIYIFLPQNRPSLAMRIPCRFYRITVVAKYKIYENSLYFQPTLPN